MSVLIIEAFVFFVYYFNEHLITLPYADIVLTKDSNYKFMQ